MHLAPFGEYAPFTEWLPFLEYLVPGQMDAGTEAKLMPVGELQFGPLICFETLFPSMAEHLRREGADFLVVITNLGWFGNSNAIPQELQVARMRAIETRLSLVHCANTGISGVFDPWGRFRVVNGYFNASNGYVKREGEEEKNIHPYSVIQRRRIGALPVPPKSAQLLPYGPVILPSFLLVGLGIYLLIFAFNLFPFLGKGSAREGSDG
jgi:apolipoprotein N-acyltransferase